jgi:hypothetical protein
MATPSNRAARKKAAEEAILVTTSAPRDGEKYPIRVQLFAPGQRGILQSVVESRTKSARIIPKLTEVQKTSNIALKTSRELRRKDHALRNSLVRAKGYLNKLQLHDKVSPKIKTHLANISKLLNTATDSLPAVDDHGDNAEREQLRQAIRESQSLCKEFQGEIKRINNVAESWMDVKWSADNTSAVGRGPPGHIAHNTFDQYTPHYDVNDVKKVIDDANRRVR